MPGSCCRAAPISARLPECRRCGCKHLLVVYTRPRRGGKIMRRRQCRHCGTRMTTYEVLPGRVEG